MCSNSAAVIQQAQRLHIGVARLASTHLVDQHTSSSGRRSEAATPPPFGTCFLAQDRRDGHLALDRDHPASSVDLQSCLYRESVTLLSDNAQ